MNDAKGMLTAVVAGVLFAGLNLAAQEITGSIRGVVLDPS